MPPWPPVELKYIFSHGFAIESQIITQPLENPPRFEVKRRGVDGDLGSVRFSQNEMLVAGEQLCVSGYLTLDDGGIEIHFDQDKRFGTLFQGNGGLVLMIHSNGGHITYTLSKRSPHIRCS